jgi:hypothetical protein
MKWKNGSTGALFKIELAPYGYTFVGKGTQSANLHCLQHESLIYSRLEKLQGDVVPVYLGIVDLARGYVINFAWARVRHIMLMSWGGEAAAIVGVQDLQEELWRSLRKVRWEGIFHDEYPRNILWNEERRRVMLVNFDRATILPAPKHKQLSRLSEKRMDIKVRRRRAGSASHHKRSAMQNELRAEE